MKALTCAEGQPADRTEVTKAKNISSFKNRFGSTPGTKRHESALRGGMGAGAEEWSYEEGGAELP